MKTQSPRIFETRDGSHSIFSETHGVSYHSKYGAVQESQHVFIEAGLYYKMRGKKQLSVLEIGLGTGLNAFMTLLEAERHQIRIDYTAVEAFPIGLEEAAQLNYPQALQAGQWQDSFLPLHACPWEQTCPLSPHFNFLKLQRKFEELAFPESFDVIYFDAFAPGAQPELWEPPVMETMYRALQPEGVLTTYCAKGSVKRTFKALGFTIEALPGPPGKREMTRALKPGI